MKYFGYYTQYVEALLLEARRRGRGKANGKNRGKDRRKKRQITNDPAAYANPRIKASECEWLDENAFQ